MKRGLLVVLALFSLAFSVSAATIHGTVYDLELNIVDSVVVEINTTPVQRMVAVGGSYSFTVSPGTYTLFASQTVNEITIYYAEESLEVTREGDFIYDLFLFPSFNEISDLEIDDLEVDVDENDYSGIIYLTILLLIVIFVAFYFLKTQKKKKKSNKEVVEKTKEKAEAKKNPELTDVELKKVIEVLKKHDKRATQKQIRKELPLSEAKVSLLIAELEHKGKLEKIKKGRGNIIILK